MDTVSLAVADGVATLSLNRPNRHNAIDDQTYEALQEANRPRRWR